MECGWGGEHETMQNLLNRNFAPLLNHNLFLLESMLMYYTQHNNQKKKKPTTEFQPHFRNLPHSGQLKDKRSTPSTCTYVCECLATFLIKPICRAHSTILPRSSEETTPLTTSSIHPSLASASPAGWSHSLLLSLPCHF